MRRLDEITITSPTQGLAILESQSSSLRVVARAPNGIQRLPCAAEMAGDEGWRLNAAKNRLEAIADLGPDCRGLLISGDAGVAVLRRRDASFETVARVARGQTIEGGAGWVHEPNADHFGLAGDFDGDGFDELVVTSGKGLAILRLEGGRLEVMARLDDGQRYGDWELDMVHDRFGPIGDLRGNGRAQLLVRNEYKGVALLELQSGRRRARSGSAPTLQFVRLSLDGWNLGPDTEWIGVGKFVDIGPQQLLVAAPGQGLGVLVFREDTRSLGVGLRATSFMGWGELDTRRVRVGPIGDFDGDGCSEVMLVSPDAVGVLGVEDGELRVSTRAPTGTALGAGWILDMSKDHFDCVGDFEARGRAQLLLTSPVGVALLELRDGALVIGASLANGGDCGGWKLDTARDKIGLEPRSVRVHVKLLCSPTFALEGMLDHARRIYAAAGVSIHHASSETLELTRLSNLEVGTCCKTCLTPDQLALFNHRNHACAGEIVIYFVRSTIPPLCGCAAHPVHAPGAVIAREATPWTFAHELGHVLGLGHVEDATSLMTGKGTARIVPTRHVPNVNLDEVLLACSRAH